LIVLLLPIAELRAQWRPSPRRIDIGLGVGYGSGGPPRTDRWLLSGALLLSRSVHDLPRGALVVAGNVSANVMWRTSDGVGGGSFFPSDVSASLLAGWTTHSEQWSGVRLLAGPSFFTATNNRRGLGVTTRIDGARRLTSRIAFVVWAPGAGAPPTPRRTSHHRHDGDRRACVALGQDSATKSRGTDETSASS